MANIKRGDSDVARDASLIPNNETDLTLLTITDDVSHAVSLSSLGFYPLILLVRADGPFLDGSNAPVQANDLWRDAGMVWSIPVAGRQTWNFMRAAGNGTTHIYIKVLGSNSTP
jgi:hypothetical protein